MHVGLVGLSVQSICYIFMDKGSTCRSLIKLVCMRSEGFACVCPALRRRPHATAELGANEALAKDAARPLRRRSALAEDRDAEDDTA